MTALIERNNLGAPAIMGRSVFDRIFDDFLHDPAPFVRNSTSGYPLTDIYQDEDGNQIIEMALAGFNKDDIEIELADSELTVRSKKREDSNKDVNLIHQGISHRSFNRKFTLSEEILVKNAEMKNGMLIIKLEKFIPENKKPKLISIK